MILAGFILPTVIHSVTGLVVPRENSSKDQQDASNSQAEEAGQELVNIQTRYRLIGGVLVGDFFHNLCDGFFVGAAFSGCGDSFGWKVALATFLHELPQELADFAILISPEAGLGRFKALAANFISGMGVLLGALIVIAAEVSDSDTGLLLAFGGGVYLHVAATECMPKIYNKDLKVVEHFACLGAFIIGALLIGLILLDHEHCVPATPEGEASSGGHAHGH
jgi:zinc transporter ZupT